MPWLNYRTTDADVLRCDWAWSMLQPLTARHINIQRFWFPALNVHDNGMKQRAHKHYGSSDVRRYVPCNEGVGELDIEGASPKEDESGEREPYTISRMLRRLDRKLLSPDHKQAFKVRF